MYKIDKKIIYYKVQNDQIKSWRYTFRVPVPDVDKGHRDAWNVFVAVVELNIKYYKVIESFIYFTIQILILFQLTVCIS